MSIDRVGVCLRPAVIIGFVLLFSGCVTQQTFQSHVNKFQRLEKQAKKNNKILAQIRGGTEGSLSAVQQDQADIKADMIDLHTEMQQLRGMVSTGSHQKEMQSQQRETIEESLVLQLSHLQNQMKSAEVRIARMEEYFDLKAPPASSLKGGAASGSKAVPAPTAAASGAAAVSSAPTKKALSSEDAYEIAYRLYKSEQYKAARTAFEQFARKYPKSQLVDNALFWIGETYYRFDDYENAIFWYQQVLEKHPKGSKTADSLLKMGYALEKIGEKQAAVVALEKLVKEHPKVSQAGVARRKIEQLKKK